MVMFGIWWSPSWQHAGPSADNIIENLNSAEKVNTGGNSIEIENCPVKSSYAIPCPAFKFLKIISLFSTPKQKASPFKKSSKIRLFRIERWHWTFSAASPCAVALISASPHINSKLNSLKIRFFFKPNILSNETVAYKILVILLMDWLVKNEPFFKFPRQVPAICWPNLKLHK